MTAVIDVPGVEEARNWLLAEARWATGCVARCYTRGACIACQFYALQILAASLAYDAALSLAHPSTNVRARQEAAWTAQADETLRRSVTW